VIVIDASVAVKWYFPEIGSDKAIELQNGEFGQLVAPDIFIVEVTAALVRKSNMEKSRTDDIRLMIDSFLANIIDGTVKTRHLSVSGARNAAWLAIGIGHPLKDCIYLGLAMELDCDLVTCDTKFAGKANGVWDRVRVLGD
jgi:predicted nucleic acid-binding protein